MVVGPGKRLFGRGAVPGGMELVEVKTSSTGVIMATYRRAGAVPIGSFAFEKPTDEEVERRARLAGEASASTLDGGDPVLRVRSRRGGEPGVHEVEAAPSGCQLFGRGMCSGKGSAWAAGAAVTMAPGDEGGEQSKRAMARREQVSSSR